MRKTTTCILLFITAFFGMFLFQQAYALPVSAGTWHRYTPYILGSAKKQLILKYNGANWGQYEDYDQRIYFKDSRTTRYRYDSKRRVMIIRYINKSKVTPSKSYSYRKLIFAHGYKIPIIKYYYKIGHGKYNYLYTVKFWMIHPIRF